MRVLIDGNTLEKQRSGIGNYTYNLLAEMAGILETGDELCIGIRRRLFDQLGVAELRGIPVMAAPEISLRKYWPTQPGWMQGFDLYHQPNYIPHCFTGRTVVTIHDMSHLVFPQYHPRRRVMMLRAFEGRLKAADRIITVSNFSKSEILHYLGVAEEKVIVTPLGAGAHFRPLELTLAQAQDLRTQYGLPERFLLYVGTIEPRKNLERLLQAFAGLKREVPGDEVKLVLAGGKGWLNEEIYARAAALKIETEVKFTGYVDSQDLPGLYNLSLAFVYPSLYEGFGLPPLEAMACGTPVISSRVASIPEVVGEAGLLVDPLQVDELTEAMRKVVVSPSLREDMMKQGLARSQQFSWQHCARQTLQVYRECLGM